jgi:hypothetical protein
MFENYHRNGGNTYDLQMVFLVYKHNMLNIVPNVNLCTNIGFDNEGSNTSVDPKSDIALKLGNRPRFELAEIVHPEKVEIDAEFEKEYFRVRVLLGESWTSSKVRFYSHKLLRPVYRAVLKKPLQLLGLR